MRPKDPGKTARMRRELREELKGKKTVVTIYIILRVLAVSYTHLDVYRRQRVRSTWIRPPAPPAEPITMGMPRRQPSVMMSSRSLNIAVLLTMATPLPSLWGPASVLPASRCV